MKAQNVTVGTGALDLAKLKFTVRISRPLRLRVWFAKTIVRFAAWLVRAEYKEEYAMYIEDITHVDVFNGIAYNANGDVVAVAPDGITWTVRGKASA